MMTEFRLPELGENVESGDVVRVLVSEGDVISPDQPLLEIETDKATIEVPSSVGGTIKEINVKPGEKIHVGQLILTVEEDGRREPARAEPEAKAEEKVQPKLIQSQEAKEALEEVTEAEPEYEVSDDTAAEKPAEPEQEEEARIAARRKDEPAEDQRTEERPPGEREPAAPRARRGQVVGFGRPARAAAQPEVAPEVAPASPSVRRLARELGVDINQVPGSGPAGRISIEDVKNYARWVITSARTLMPAAAPATGALAPPLPDFTQWGEVERNPMSNIRRKTAEQMAYAWSTAPRVTQYDKADITALEQLRQQFGRRAEAAGGKLTVTAIILKVAAFALKVFPQFNASLDMANEEIIYKKYYHIGVAVDTDRGLLVPVIRDVDKKNIIELSVELTTMAEKARNKKLTLEEMQGGTFTITNLGGIGGTNFSPIVNAPEAAILGVARASLEPVFVDGQFEPRLMLPLSLSYDHRLIDGADAARFVRWVVEALQQPFLLALEG
jgi:pyruvate dehydrogenase E2 component (dihydrolipoamide acetyltransferase)